MHSYRRVISCFNTRSPDIGLFLVLVHFPLNMQSNRTDTGGMENKLPVRYS
ncbi:hypothetical protein MOSE0_G01530 [Monosporozyma servazzii]